MQRFLPKLTGISVEVIAALVLLVSAEVLFRMLQSTLDSMLIMGVWKRILRGLKVF